MSSFKISKWIFHLRNFIFRERTPNSPLWGVILDSKLSFNSHINTIIKKADCTRQFLQRNLRGCSSQVKAAAYKTFVRPVVEYASCVWDPYGRSNTQVEKLEAMQHRAGRFAVADWRRQSSITAILDSRVAKPSGTADAIEDHSFPSHH